MPKVIITPSSIFNPIGVRLLLGEVGVIGPMLQDETTITCIMTEAQIERFRNGRGAAHRVEIVPDAPPPVVEDNEFIGTPIVDVIDSENDDDPVGKPWDIDNRAGGESWDEGIGPSKLA